MYVKKTYTEDETYTIDEKIRVVVLDGYNKSKVAKLQEERNNSSVSYMDQKNNLNDYRVTTNQITVNGKTKTVMECGLDGIINSNYVDFDNSYVIGEVNEIPSNVSNYIENSGMELIQQGDSLIENLILGMETVYYDGYNGPVAILAGDLSIMQTEDFEYFVGSSITYASNKNLDFIAGLGDLNEIYNLNKSIMSSINLDVCDFKILKEVKKRSGRIQSPPLYTRLNSDRVKGYIKSTTFGSGFLITKNGYDKFVNLKHDEKYGIPFMDKMANIKRLFLDSTNYTTIAEMFFDEKHKNKIKKYHYESHPTFLAESENESISEKDLRIKHNKKSKHTALYRGARMALGGLRYSKPGRRLFFTQFLNLRKPSTLDDLGELVSKNLLEGNLNVGFIEIPTRMVSDVDEDGDLLRNELILKANPDYIQNK